MKKRNYKEEASRARSRAREEREEGRTNVLVSTVAPTAAALVAPSVAKYIPGPTEQELAGMALRKSSPASSKRVLIPLTAAAGVAWLMPDNTLARFGAMFLGGLAGAYCVGTAIKLGQIDSTTLAQAAPKE